MEQRLHLLTSEVTMLALRILILGSLIGCGRAVAQQPEPSTAPVRCFVYAADTARLETHKAKQLCLGATSDIPARCFAEASDQLRMSDEFAVELCRMASSLEPTRCAHQLTNTTNLTHGTIVRYCAAQRWPVVHSPRGGVPECVATALKQTNLSETDAARLCAGSTDLGPVACYESGDDETTLSANDLVDLCGVVVVASPTTPVF